MAYRDDVEGAFQAILQRSPTPDELDAALASEQNDAALLALVESLANSAEVEEFIAPMLRFYQAVFGRLADTGGLDFWTNVYRSQPIQALDDPNTVNVDEALLAVARFFVSSSTPEFVALYGVDPSASEYVTSLYHNALGRQPDAAGQAFWVQVYNDLLDGLAGGAPPTEAMKQEVRAILLEQFVSSEECEQRAQPAVENFLVQTALDGGPLEGTLWDNIPSQEPEVDLSSSTEDEEILLVDGTPRSVTTGEGDDTVRLGSGGHTVDTGDGDDTVVTGAGNDTVSIGDGNDIAQTGAGNDLIVAGNGGGIDIIDGGPGGDTVSYPSATNAVLIDLREEDRSAQAAGATTIGDILTGTYDPTTPVGYAEGTDIETDVLISIENAEGGAGSDTIFGNDGNNALRGMDGDDEIDGFGGDDELLGGAGADELRGGEGHDLLDGGAGDDTIDGGAGWNRIRLSGNLDNYDVVTNLDGTYTITDNRAGSPDGSDTFTRIQEVVFANTTVGLWSLVDPNEISGAGIINGTAARDRMEGSDGDDELRGFDAEDQLVGGDGNDLLDGGPSAYDDSNFVWDIVNYFDEYWQNPGIRSGVTVDLINNMATDTYGANDTIYNIERVFGTPLGDTIIGSDNDVTGEAYDPYIGADTIHGNGGYDNLRYNLAEPFGTPGGITVTFDATIVGAGTAIDPAGDIDTFTGIEAITATHSDDILTGGAGWQRFMPLNGADTVDGGADSDMVAYHNDASYGGLAGIAVDLAIVDGQGYASATDGWGNVDRLRDVEEIRGTGAADTILGDAADNIFEGRQGNDTLEGREGSDRLLGGLGDDDLDGGAGADDLFGDSGNDTINGGLGDDYLSGGLGFDQFVIAAGDGNDTVADFVLGEDTLDLAAGLTITSLTEAEVGGEPGLDTLVTLSSGDVLTLLDVSGVSDPAQLTGAAADLELFIA